MSRSVRDLREIICVSRLSGINDESFFEKLENEVLINISQKNQKGKKVAKKSKTPQIKTNISEYKTFCQFIDDELLKDLLNRANKDLNWLCQWSLESESVCVNFINWWLIGVSDNDRRELINLEYDIVCAEVVMTVRGRCGGEDEAERAARHLLSVILWEYPHKMLSEDTSVHLFLDYLDSLTSPQLCKHLLSAVPLTTQDHSVIHYSLSLRAFSIVSIWSALVRFHRQLIITTALPLAETQTHSGVSPGSVLSRLPIVMSQNFIAVLKYWIEMKKVDIATFRDLEGRNILTVAVSFKSRAIVEFLVDSFDMSSIINTVSEAGNSALHLAVCQGSLDLVKLLVDNCHADINIINPSCDNCTPLQMALIYGQEDIVKFLLKKGADPSIVTTNNYNEVSQSVVFEESNIVEFEGGRSVEARVSEQDLSLS